MNILHKKLHLQHHQHTGKLLHHSHTSFRSLAIVLGLAGLLMVGFGALARATADSLYVYARNPAPIPTEPATITSHPSSSAVKGLNFVISGNCPVITPRVIMVIFEGDIDIGSGPCDEQNHFHVAVSLSQGTHSLVARSTTITDDSGPDSEAILVVVTDNPVVVPPRSTPLQVTIDRPFIVFGPGKDAAWIGSVSDGQGPYIIHINWGDGTTSVHNFSKPGQQIMTHHYSHMRPYSVTLTVNDNSGQEIIRQFVAVTPYIAPLGPIASTRGGSGSIDGQTLIGAYGAYVAILAVFGIAWISSHRFVYAKVPVRTTARTTQKPRNAHSTRKR